jgi:hypothetical protein
VATPTLPPFEVEAPNMPPARAVFDEPSFEMTPTLLELIEISLLPVKVAAPNMSPATLDRGDMAWDSSPSSHPMPVLPDLTVLPWWCPPPPGRMCLSWRQPMRG